MPPLSNPEDWLSQAADLFHTRDVGGRIVYANPAARTRFGWSEGVAASDNSSDSAGAQRMVSRTGFWRGEVRRQDASGNMLLLRSHWSAIRDHEGALAGFFVVEIDVTEERSHQQASLRAQRMEGIGTLAGGVAHEINNVLGPILMGAEMIRSRVDDPWVKQKLVSMEESARRGAQVVRQVLEFSRGLEGEMIALDLGHLLRDLVSFAKQTFSRTVAITADFPNDLAYVKGDATLLRQMVLNLMLNARDAMPDGGSLIIRAASVDISSEEATQLSPEACPGSFVRIDVCDTGEGLSDKVRDRMFEPFFTTRSRGQGTGMGLSTALTIVRGHHGFFVVSGEEGRGTTFSVYIPASPRPGSSDMSDDVTTEESVGSEHLILVVDDEPFMLEMNLDMLDSFGFKTIGASNGREGLEAFRSKPQIHLVITDMNMPVMDGATMIKEIRKLAPDVPLVAISGMPEHRHLVEGTGIDDIEILQKPYTTAQLLGAVMAALDNDQPGIPTETGESRTAGNEDPISEDDFDSFIGGDDL